MATKPAPRPAPRLYLATPAVEDPAQFLPQLQAALAAADVAAVLLRLKPSDPRTTVSRVKALVPVIQQSGAALLLDAGALDGQFELVARSGADGAHLGGIAAMDEAMAALKPDRIVGVGALATRHDSMSAGEQGADYVLFGEADAQGLRPSREAVAERVGWWAELFEPPCVAYAASPDEARDFVAAGADFILVDDLVWSDPRGAAAALAELGAVIGEAFASASQADRSRTEVSQA
ncbi:MAG TPA: thiamine phosphate synthase [Bradyrhizobium sp.]|nr:thiamine phosphate synthase [Bradyrhizobium sp.]